MSKMKATEIEAKSILVKSKLPDTDYVINAYTGCQFGCQYCYASFMGRFVDEKFEDWGKYVYVKTNAVELIQKRVTSMRPEGKQASILMSSVTDPYHGVEKKYELTRGVLEVLSADQWPGTVSILTKSPLVLRDVDVITQLPKAEVGLTVTTTDDELSKFLETHAPPVSKRLDTMKKLVDAGIETYCFVGPLLPHFREQPELLDDLFEKIAATGVKSIYVEHINLSTYIRNRLFNFLDERGSPLKSLYEGALSPEHREELDQIVAELMAKHGLSLRLNEVIYHEDL
jgi:DNA repair photolyase